MMGDARRPHRLLLLGVVLLIFAMDSLLLIGLRLVDPYIIGFRVVVYPMTVVSALYLAMPGVLALVWAWLLLWEAYCERREVRKLVRVEY